MTHIYSGAVAGKNNVQISKLQVQSQEWKVYIDSKNK